MTDFIVFKERFCHTLIGGDVMYRGETIELHPELRSLSDSENYIELLIDSVSAEAEHREALQRKLHASSSEESEHNAHVLGSIFAR